MLNNLRKVSEKILILALNLLHRHSSRILSRVLEKKIKIYLEFETVFRGRAEPCQTSEMKHFPEVAISAKSFILGVWQSSEYASVKQQFLDSTTCLLIAWYSS